MSDPWLPQLNIHKYVYASKCISQYRVKIGPPCVLQPFRVSVILPTVDQEHCVVVTIVLVAVKTRYVVSFKTNISPWHFNFVIN